VIQIDARGHDLTVVAFSGMASKNRIYEWTRSFDGVNANFIGVRDDSRRWYQLETSDIAEVVRRAVVRAGGARVMTIGASAGGFAALLFGRILRADRILVWSPQSACGAIKRALGDNRWPDLCNRTPACDLEGVYPEAVVHVAADDPMDMMHARRLTPGRLIIHSSGGHNLPTMLKESGELRWILDEAVAA